MPAVSDVSQFGTCRKQMIHRLSRPAGGSGIERRVC